MTVSLRPPGPLTAYLPGTAPERLAECLVERGGIGAEFELGRRELIENVALFEEVDDGCRGHRDLQIELSVA